MLFNNMKKKVRRLTKKRLADAKCDRWPPYIIEFINVLIAQGVDPNKAIEVGKTNLHNLRKQEEATKVLYSSTPLDH